jgi:signal transduction histidine kinase
MIALASKLFPQRIAGQIAVLVVTSVLLAHAVITLTFLLLSPRPGLMHPSARIIDDLALSAKLIDASSSSGARADILRSIRAFLPTVEVHDEPLTAERHVDVAPVDVLQAELGDRFDVFALRPMGTADRPTHIAIVIPGGTTLVAPLWPPLRFGAFPPFLIGALVFLVSAIALLSLWAAGALTAPLTRFAVAAERFTIAGFDAPLPERGPKEVVRAARALNELRERVRRLVEDRGRMLAAVSHDLRTPITRLRLRAEDIEQEPLRLHVIRDLDTMQNMVQSALSFLRGQATTARCCTVDLPSLVQTVCDGFGDLGHRVAFIGPQHTYVQCDPEQLTRAITNLVENGVKFGTSVVVRIVTSDGADISIEVEDDGPGLSKHEKQLVVEPFYRGDSARGFNGQCSFGLGLSISKIIVEAHNGTLELNDAQPHGLVVRVVLPQADPQKVYQNQKLA